MQRRTRLTLLALILTPFSLGMMAEGCQGPDRTELEGVWTLTRGDVEATFTFTVANGGEVEQESATATLEPQDTADFPEQLADLVAQWNAGLEQLNANLDAALPDEVIATFPAFAQMRLVDPDDETQTAAGLIDNDDQYLFIGDLSGAGQGDEQGGGAVLEFASVEGSFDRVGPTTEGQIVRHLGVLLIGANDNALAFTVEIKVYYTGVRGGDVPA